MYFFIISNKEGNKQWVESEENRPQIARTAKNSKKQIFCIFFAADGIVTSKVIPEDTNVNNRFYSNTVLSKVFNNFMKKKNRHTVKDVLLYYDNARSHKADIVTNYLKKKCIKLMPHLPYSPDLTPCDFYLFPKIKNELAGRHFEQVENLAKAIKTITDNICMDEYNRCFKNLQTWLKTCIEFNEEFFERMY
ncbi:15183_t:CDS:1 [Racocetra persica]|uniref:15183_t:CDS:1 n=1 Tax=Racocetra persica TaxID=160502 RepID=A0ACA9MYW3_9GLOM|nr:15183_t:CDS:1 [Racocetra persica]